MGSMNISSDLNQMTVHQNINKDSSHLLDNIQRLTKENKNYLQQIEEYKSKDNIINELEKKLKKSEIEIDNLSQSLNKSQNNFIELQRRDEIKLNKLTQKVSSD